jgi:hypothetical protein
MADQFNRVPSVAGSRDGRAPSPNPGNDYTAPSDSSGETLDHDKISQAQTQPIRKRPKYVPLYLGDLGFGRLAIDDNPSYPKGEDPFSSGPTGEASYPSSHLPATHTRSSSQGNKYTGYQNRDNPHNSRGMSYPASRSYHQGNQRNDRNFMSPDAQATQDLMMARNAVRRMFKHSAIAKWKLADYAAHQRAMIASSTACAAARATEAATSSPWPTPVLTPEVQETMRHWGLQGNFDEIGNHSRILGEPTIWCRDWLNGKDEVAPWPCAAELKWEGDDRAKTGVGRFPPLPREPGPAGLPWHALELVEQYPLDQIARIPTMEDVFLPVDQIDEDVKGRLLWSVIDEAIDEFLAT